ncbi:GGDEF domain-containing protein [Gloeocapsa sp. PCC 73106]|uniref:GGDEF domain-containing protein n=1 Tax=Gloeocapsa sp. PCC 73106 TaxID=102232 RepID=UPI0002ACBC77|nr:GGDEF domain-containing protein [Gloeocapsa sp. PCC 73106]ELR96926.1 diguanylate cyclase (GGDEF) domain-containing protein [Gloeocapsa sp. PCC 73106]
MVITKSLWLYQTLDSFIWLQSYPRKIFLVCFVGTHIPLLSLITYLLLFSRDNQLWMICIIILLGTLLGTVITLWGLYLLLVPVMMTRQALKDYLNKHEMKVLPTNFKDEAGQLLRDLDHTLSILTETLGKLKKQASVDFLTGLLNRRGAIELLKTPQKIVFETWGLGVIDIDYFKKINDTWGHEAGDDVLKIIGKYLGKSIRQPDIAARWGGEEFLVIIEGDLKSSNIVLERIRSEIADLEFVGAITAKVTVSIGGTIYEPKQEEFDKALARADNALYKAKKEGRNRVIWL